MFVNFTNHPKSSWLPEQLKNAQIYGDVVDMEFPGIDSGLSCEDVSAMAHEYALKIAAMNPKAVLCQGEMTFAFAVVMELLSLGIKVVAACTERKVSMTQNENGIIIKQSEFMFRGFREYCVYDSVSERKE